MLSRRHLLASGIAFVGVGLGQRLTAFDLDQEVIRPVAKTAALRQQAAAWLVANQGVDGRLVPGNRFTVGITALATLALVAPGGLPASHPAVQRAYAFVAKHRQADGGFYDPADGNALYTTALALQLHAALEKDGDLSAAQTFINRQQMHGGDDGDGGFSADASGLPDLHATTAAIDGLIASGVPLTDPHLLAARRFVLACQEGGSGGATYSPDPRQAAGDHDTSGGATLPARAQAYGAMTHAYLADLIVLGYSREDPRLRSALRWIGETWTLASHPGRPAGRGQEGLFGYYAAVGKTCHLLGDLGPRHAQGQVIDWRGDLAAALSERAQVQRLADGSDGVCWRNGADRWGEALPHLSTAYALRCLAWIEEV